ncbi:MAG: AAA family ATPase [Kofleriaceae bacterium]|nr:AAA family ATPase [Kofleriaceae bacterium]
MIRRLRVKGFRRYVDAAFEFGPGVTFIDGKNNAGKTTLFLAIEYALTGTVAGARSQMMLLNPGAKGLGVELVFVGRDRKTYKLQRVHQLPPRAKSRLVGHFTLKEIVGDGDERYILSSDFQDHEDALAKKLAEITGISRRVLDLAVHIRQGDIASILEGDPRLDIALGITAAGTANEEMRSLALEDEQAAEALPALEASLAHVERERGVASSDESALRAKLEQLRGEAAGLATRQDDDANDDSLAALSAAVDAWRDASDDVERAEQALAAVAVEDTLDRDRAELKRTLEAAAARGDEVERRYDLQARIRRRAEQVERGATTCDHCGAPLDSSRAAAELAEWKRELDALLAGAIDVRGAEDRLREVDRKLSELRGARKTAETARQVQADAESAARALVPGDSRRLDEIEAERQTLHERKKLDRAAQAARDEARLEAITSAIADIETRLATQASRGGELDREHARLADEVDRLRRRRRRAADFRMLASAFKTLQEDLRTRAATELAASTFAIHKALSVEHEILEVAVDPARYQVLVTPRDTGQAMPASLAQGGGHRLLLGLAFRLALVERLGPFPFVLLDEPTYGLDEPHRQALLERISSLSLCEQILVITHHAMGSAPGQQRIVVDKLVAA